MGERLSIKTDRDEQQLFNRRAIVAAIIVLLALAGIGLRLYFLQVEKYDFYTDLSKQNYQKRIPIPPTRGQIYDRNGVLLADNHAQYVLKVVRDGVPDQNGDGKKNWADMQIMLDRLNKLVPLTEKDLRIFNQQIRRRSRYQPTPLKENMTEQEVAMFAVNKSRFPGVELDRQMQRYYPWGQIASHVIGYVGRIDEQDMEHLNKDEYEGTTYIGKLGVEGAHEKRLHGQAGYTIQEVDAHGRHQDVLSRKAAVGGEELILGLDIKLQIRAENLLRGERGAIVAIDPNNGEVLALASVPTFDPNLFVDGISHKDYIDLRDHPNRPLYNRALQGTYPPGSTVKPMVAMAGLFEKVVWPGKAVYDPGFFQIPGHKHRYRCWKKVGHGSVNMEYAIAQSCDTYFYDLAYRMGIDRFNTYMKTFGFGSKTGIDLTSESPGLMPSSEWKQSRHKQVWYPGDTVNIGIGQGYWLATPLQLAHAVSTIAMRGKRIKPHVLRGFRIAKDKPPQLLEPEVLNQVKSNSARDWELVKQGMVNVVHATFGTAKRIAPGMQYMMAGKTGTAQVFGIAQNARYDASRLDKRLHDHALFVGFAPADAPKIAVAVIVENGGGGSATAAPLARKIMDAYLLNKYEDDPVEDGKQPATPPPTNQRD